MCGFFVVVVAPLYMAFDRPLSAASLPMLRVSQRARVTRRRLCSMMGPMCRLPTGNTTAVLLVQSASATFFFFLVSRSGPRTLAK